MKAKLLLGLLLCFFVSSLHAQSWRYGKRGGSADVTSSAGHPPDEDVFDMATDNNGNVYVLASVMQTSLNVDGHALTGYGYHDVLVYSFKCDGTFRWSKLIGAAGDDWPHTLSVDKLGGVYISFLSTINYSPHASAEIGGDTTLSYTDKSFFMVKYDTAGNYKWLLAPQSDTVSASSITYTRTLDVNVDSIGNIYWLCRLPAGVYAGGSLIVPSYGVYLLKYNSFGIFQAAQRMPVMTDVRGGGTWSISMQTTPVNGKVYLSGEYEEDGGFLVLGSDTVKHGMYISCFDRSSTFLWDKQDTLTANAGVGFLGRLSIDRSDNLYLGGTYYGTDIFNSYVMDQPNGGSFIVKLDSNGNNIWMHASVTNAATFGGGVALRNNGEVILTGMYPGLLKWPDANNTDSFNSAPNTGYHIYIARFNSQTGNLIAMDSIATDFGDNARSATPNGQGEKTAILSDGKDNVYVAGNFDYDLKVNGTTLYNAGGETDFFVAKYGFDNCGCSSVPAAAYSVSTNHLTADFTYSGTAADSLRWDFGDGSTSTATNPSHTYADTGYYTACVTIHAACGDDLQCQDIHVSGPISVATINAGNGISVYPNPVSGTLYVAHASGAMLKLFNITGQQLYSCIAAADRQAINMTGLPAGSYLLQLTDTNGNRTTVTVIKQ